jgi:hypothetical protein
MSKRPQAFEVTAIEHFDADDKGDIKDPIIHHWKDSVIGTDEADIEFQVKRKLASGLKSDKAVQSLSKRLKIDVSCPFRL